MTGWQREGNIMSRDACVVPSGGNSIVLGDEYSTTWTPSVRQGVGPMEMPAGGPQANTKVLLYRFPPTILNREDGAEKMPLKVRDSRPTGFAGSFNIPSKLYHKGICRHWHPSRLIWAKVWNSEYQIWGADLDMPLEWRGVLRSSPLSTLMRFFSENVQIFNLWAHTNNVSTTKKIRSQRNIPEQPTKF